MTKRMTDARAKRIARNIQILLAYYDGVPQRTIAAKFRLTQGRISQIIQAARPIYEGMHS